MLESSDSYMFTRPPSLSGRQQARPFTVRWWRGATLGWALLALGLSPAWPQVAAEAAAPGAAGVAAVATAGAPPMADAQLARALDSLRQQQRELVDLRLRLASAESAAGWLPWLFLGLVGMVGVAVWQGLRVRRLKHEKSRSDWAAAEAELHATLMPDAPGSGAPALSPGDAPLLSSGAVPGRPAVAVAVDVAPADLPGARADAPASTARERLAELSRAERTLTSLPDATPRAVTVEEMLDLEQQVDFFMVLGQEHAAIDLLLGHVRATGGVNAMPYLKLLEIYKQQGDEDAFERTRERFNQRFNAVAPPFGADLTAGRHLDDYVALLARLQQAWQQPMRALAELEGQLLRRADLEPLDLPAFHDLLTLHALVRDLPVVVPGTPLPPPAHAALAAPVAPVAANAVPATSSMSPAMAAALASARAGLNSDRTQTLLSFRQAEAADDEVDLLLPLDAEPLDTTLPRPRLADPGLTRAMVADWMQARSTVRASELALDPSLPAELVSRSARLDLDLTELSPAPREFTRPAAFTEAGLRHNTRPSDLSPFDDSDLLPPSITRR